MSPPRVASAPVIAARSAPLRWGRALVACLASAAAVIGLAVVLHPGRVQHVAQAIASWPTRLPQGGEASAANWAYAERLRHSVLSDAFLQAAIRRAAGQTCDADDDWPSPSEVRGWLEIGVRPPGPDGRVEVVLTCRAKDAGRAHRLAEALAEETLAWAAAEEAQSVLAVRHTAEAAVQQARQRHRQAQARWEAFLDDHFAEHQAAAEARPKGTKADEQHAAALGVPSAARGGASSGPPSREAKQTAENGHWASHGESLSGQSQENPHWLRLNHELEGLRSELAIMLIERTTAHPAVQDLQRRIRELEVHLGSVPRWLSSAGAPQKAVSSAADTRVSGGAGDPQATSAAQPQGNPGDHPGAAELTAHSEAAQTYRKRKEEWLAAARELDQAESEERRLLARQWASGAPGATPAVVRLPPARVEGRPRNWAHLAALALAAGLTAAFGTLLVSAGLDMDIPLASAEQARKHLPAPVIGTLRVASQKPVAPAGGSLGRKVGLVAAGTLAIATCVTLVAVSL